MTTDERVLVLMPTAKDGARTREALSGAGLECIVCTDLATFCLEIEKGGGVGLLTEEAIGTDRVGRLQAALAKQPPWSDFPLVVLAREGSEGARLRESMNATLVERPVKLRSLLSVIRAALRSRRHQYAIRDHLAQRTRYTEVLRESEERYRTLFEKIDEGFCVIEVIFEGDSAVDYRFLEVNPAFEKHTGLSDAAGKTMRELAPAHDAHWFEIYGNVARTGTPARFVNEAKALGGRWFEVYAFRPGQDNKVAILFSDISSRILGERERERLVEQLRESDRKKDDFIALLAHELRNPLAPIRNGLQVLRLAAGDAAAVGQARAMMDRQLTHMVRLIDDLLDVSRIGRNKMELRRERVLLADVVASAVETARPLIEAAGHELIVSLPAGPIFLNADLTRLAQVLSNLLTNSARYTDQGGKIQLAAERRGSELMITVRDNGIGIPAESLPTIFDMFSQVDRSIERSTGGLGIGLALVRGLVEMHGGTVTAESPGEGMGTTFTVKLPATEASPARPDARSSDNGSNRLHCRILVVDDNEDSATSMAIMLRLLGNEVRTAHDGIAAVEAAEEFLPQVILMDIGMPRLNGLEATRHIREQSWGKEIIILALTGWGQESDREQSRAAGCNGHLVKPVTLAELEKLLAVKLV